MTRKNVIALLISLIVLFVVSIYSMKALASFWEYKEKVNPTLELSIETFHFFLQNELKKELLLLGSPKPLSDAESPLITFHLTVDQKDIDSLNSNLPESGKESYADAWLKISNYDKPIKVQIRYRGETHLHWLYEQKSLRIKLKNDIYNMELKFNLINPPHAYSFVDSVNYEEAKKLNLLSPEYFPVRVVINGKYMGVYYYLSQIDESTLRKVRRMPGSIYAGDGGADGDKDGVSRVWRDEIFWNKVSSRNSEQASNRDDIKLFIKAVNSFGDIDFFNFANDFLDKEKFYTFIALDNFFGAYHHDYNHNHKIYFDPYKGKFEPFALDLRHWSTNKSKDVALYPLLERITLNPILEMQRDIVLFNMTKKLKINDIISDLYTYKNLIVRDLESDIYRDNGRTVSNVIPTLIGSSYDIDELENYVTTLKNTLMTRNSIIKNILEESTVSYYKENDNVFVFKVDGNSPVEINMNININECKIYKDKDFNFKLSSEDELINEEKQILFPGRKYKEGNALSQADKYTYGTKYLVNAPLYYSFIFDGKCETFNDLSMTNFITGTQIKSKYEKFNITNTSDSIHPWKIPHSEHRIKILSGIVEVKKSLIFDRYTTVKINSGTTFVIDENSSIYFYGKVEAIGTKARPIKFMAKDATKPWGLVAVQGKSASGSKFKYCEFENGSVDTHNLIHYTSPFNIHDVDWFEVRNCKVGRNFVGDDAMHIAYSKGIVDNCFFDGARSDGLDIDISDVNITNNIFKNSGNDGLDVMTTTMNASNNTFIDTGDKGISVGEWSNATIKDSTFTRTLIGLEIKDKSKVIANNLMFIDSKEKAINLYNKNKRYDEGGFLEATNLSFVGNSKVTADKRSKVTIHD